MGTRKAGRNTVSHERSHTIAISTGEVRGLYKDTEERQVLGNVLTPNWEPGEVLWLSACELQAKADLQ